MAVEPTKLTPVECYGNIWAKREDRAAYTDAGMPSGAKVRQFMAMARTAPPGTPMIVGCAAVSAMQVYVAAAARAFNTRAIVYVPGRATPTASTRWAASMGAEINEVRPGYASVYRKRARDRAMAEGGAIKWNVDHAIEDTAAQVRNIPADVARIVVPTGSGLTAIGVLVGLARIGRNTPVFAPCVSDMAELEKIIETVQRYVPGWRAARRIAMFPPQSKYETPVHRTLPNGDMLDPYYAAKAWGHVRPGDCLWVSGRRPTAACD